MILTPNAANTVLVLPIMLSFVQGLMMTRQRLRKKQVQRLDVYRLINLGLI